MTSITLACGPFFDESGALASLIVLLVIKPLAYFAFIQAFRYRVARPIPMPFARAAWLAAARTALGFVIIGAGALALKVIDSSSAAIWTLSWIYLYAERVFSWWWIGKSGAGLVGRRLAGWIISGTLINAVFDVGMVAGLFGGWIWPAATAAAIGAFIAALHFVGRRASLKWRFATAPTCAACGYDLRGNLSGRCPECGASVVLLVPAPAVT